MIAAIVSLFFWPALILAFILSAVGIVRRQPWLLVLGAVLTVPISLYIGLGGDLSYGILVALLPLCLAAGALAVRSDRRALAALLLLPPLGYFGWFAWNVSQQDPGAPLPPGPTLTAAGIPVPAVRNAHCWEQRGGRTCADGLSGPATIEAKGLKPTVVPAGSLLNVHFQVEPRSFRVLRWSGDRPDPVDLDDGRVPMPRDPGLYTYSVSASWPRRGSLYTFLVEVR